MAVSAILNRIQDSTSAVPARVQAYVETIVQTCADGGRSLVSVILFGTLLATVGVATGGSWPQLFLDLVKDLK